MLVRLVRKGDSYVPDRFAARRRLVDGLGEANNAAWKTMALDADGSAGGAARLDRLSLGRAGQMEP